MTKKILFLTFAIANTLTAFSQCDTTNTAFKTIVAKYESIYKEIEPDTTKGPWSKNPEIGWAGDIDIKMVNKNISYDLVAITMKNKKISFNTLKLTMKQKKIVFKSVETTMENKTIGYKPEFTCNWKGCKTKMTPIITKVPVAKTVTKTISTDIPEFKYAATNIVTKIPEFKKDRKEIILKLPEVTITTASTYARTQKEEADKLKDKYETISNEQQKEMISAVISTFDCQQNEILAQRSRVSGEFENAILEIDKSINNLRGNGLDPSNLTSEDGSKVNLIQLRAEILLQYEQALTQFDDALRQILEKEKDVIQSMA